MLVSTIAMSDDSLAPLFRHRDAMSKLESIELGLGFVLGELLTEFSRFAAQSAAVPRAGWS